MKNNRKNRALIKIRYKHGFINHMNHLVDVGNISGFKFIKVRLVGLEPIYDFHFTPIEADKAH